MTPPYLYVLGIVALTAKWFRDHTVTEMPAMDHVNCDKYWWRNALYINTFFTFKERCMGWSWYLSNDTQFYVVGVTILMIAVKHLWFAASTLLVLMLGAWTTTALVTISTNHRPSIQEPFAQYDELYDKPWTRIGPYLVGMSIGYLLYRKNCTISINKYVVLLGWTLALTCTSCVVYGLYYVDLTPVTSATYVSLSHTVWACAMAWILVACCTGHGGYVNAVLSWRYLFPLSRLSYCAYLVHPVLMRSAVLNYDSSIHITRDIVFIWYFGFVVSSYAVAFPLALDFEAPVISIFKMANSPRRS
uniref:Acyltransferase 3 domain-containing protein n=1 Tax=Timema poppense TaxID=170557 RepID=A0A7R9HCB7_TIMPO|nr:unnamed protein product [Timema poppensis]